MDDTMTKNTLRLLKLAPIMLLMNGYWMISNKQIFGNVWSYLDEDTDTMMSGHVLGEFTIDWATPLEATAIASLLILVSQVIFAPFLQLWGFTMQGKDIIVDEDLPNFFTAIKLSQADEVVLESRNCKRNYGIEI